MKTPKSISRLKHSHSLSTRTWQIWRRRCVVQSCSSSSRLRSDPCSYSSSGRTLNTRIGYPSVSAECVAELYYTRDILNGFRRMVSQKTLRSDITSVFLRETTATRVQNGRENLCLQSRSFDQPLERRWRRASPNPSVSRRRFVLRCNCSRSS